MNISEQVDHTLFGLSHLSIEEVRHRILALGLGVGFSNRKSVKIGNWGEMNIIIELQQTDDPLYVEIEIPVYFPSTVDSLSEAVSDLVSFCVKLYNGLGCDYLVAREDYGEYEDLRRNDFFGIYKSSILKATFESDYVVVFGRTFEALLEGIPAKLIELEFTPEKTQVYQNLGFL